MTPPRMQSGLALLLALLVFSATTLVHASEEVYRPRSTNDPPVEAMLADGFLLRPAGLVATAVGSVAFVITLPFSLITRSVDKAAQKMVVDPARYTFVRPFGQIESDRPSR